MEMKEFTTPILFLIFNRPLMTEKVFERIKEIKPKYLYISADGPRKNITDDQLNCEKTRKLIEKIDWDCNLQLNFNEVNLGCKNAVSSGITWFFENVEEGIILEDDCIPDISFFIFCSMMLEKYRNDDRIMHIGGTNFQDGTQRGNGSYYFSNFCHVWGWATWKRAWDLYDVDIKKYPEFITSKEFTNTLRDLKEQKYWMKYFLQVYNKQKDTWDYQWTFTIWYNKGLSIVPNVNLVTNIGFGQNATHTTLNSNVANRPAKSIGKIRHPNSIFPDITADHYTFKKYMNPNKIRKILQILFS